MTDIAPNVPHDPAEPEPRPEGSAPSSADAWREVAPPSAATASRPTPGRAGRWLAGLVAVLALLALAGFFAIRAGVVPGLPGWLAGSFHEEARPADDPLARRAAQTAAQVDASAARVAELEGRMGRLQGELEAAAGTSGHAEAMLVAIATRRAVERGQPLGYLETQLRLRFGTGQPAAVEKVIAAAHHPVTLPFLMLDLERISPSLGDTNTSGGWAWIRAEFNDLLTVRSNDQPAPTPSARIARAKLFLADNRVDMAVGEVEQLPGKTASGPWLREARDYLAAQQAMDQIESAAILASAQTGLPPTALPANAAPAPAPSPAPTATP